jgi:hypothetical protein
MPYAIVGILSLGLVISSIRTVVTEKNHVRRRLVALMMRRYQKRVDRLKTQVHRYLHFFPTVSNCRKHAAIVGLSMMVMGPHLQPIHEESIRPYVERIDREERRKKALAASEKWTEVYSFLFSLFIFLVLIHLCRLLI